MRHEAHAPTLECNEADRRCKGHGQTNKGRPTQLGMLIEMIGQQDNAKHGEAHLGDQLGGGVDHYRRERPWTGKPGQRRRPRTDGESCHM